MRQDTDMYCPLSTPSGVSYSVVIFSSLFFLAGTDGTDMGTVDPTHLRGLVTACPEFVAELPRSRFEGQPKGRLIVRVEDSPNQSLLSQSCYMSNTLLVREAFTVFLCHLAGHASPAVSVPRRWPR